MTVVERGAGGAWGQAGCDLDQLLLVALKEGKTPVSRSLVFLKVRIIEVYTVCNKMHHF